MKTCCYCDYWSSNGVNNTGYCFNPKMEIVSMDVAMRNNGVGLIHDGVSAVNASHVFYGAYFGCIHWKSAKQDEMGPICATINERATEVDSSKLG